ncbi:MAG: response regulator transcription factor [Pseudomonadota bacterium]|nr:response regulator transcription factor [Gammaproteobacteria bacterium]MDQ3580215.1 response regulator transcription factor [Pseudomonadota bacterium]
MTIRILITDDHCVVAEGLRYLIQAQADMEVIACVQDGRQAVRRSMETRPDVVLMDNAMPELNGTGAMHIICERCPETRVIMLSMYSDPIHVCRALQAGAMGYVAKKSMAKEVVDAIRAVHSGKRYLSRPLVDSVIDHFLSNPLQDPLECLSSRERQVLQMLAEGRSVFDIACTLSLSPKTVETYRARMMDKLAIQDLAGLIKFAIQQGIVSFE